MRIYLYCTLLKYRGGTVYSHTLTLYTPKIVYRAYRYESESGGNRSMLASAECCGGGGPTEGRENEHQSRTRAQGEWRHRPRFLPLRANLSHLEFQLIRSGVAKATVNALLERAKKTLLFERRPLAVLLGGETVRSHLLCLCLYAQATFYCMNSSNIRQLLFANRR